MKCDICGREMKIKQQAGMFEFKCECCGNTQICEMLEESIDYSFRPSSIEINNKEITKNDIKEYLEKGYSYPQGVVLYLQDKKRYLDAMHVCEYYIDIKKENEFFRINYVESFAVFYMPSDNVVESYDEISEELLELMKYLVKLQLKLHLTPNQLFIKLPYTHVLHTKLRTKLEYVVSCYKTALNFMSRGDVKSLRKAMLLLSQINCYESEAMLEICRALLHKKTEELNSGVEMEFYVDVEKELQYQEALKLVDSEDVELVKKAKEIFEALGDYRDSSYKVFACEEKLVPGIEPYNLEDLYKLLWYFMQGILEDEEKLKYYNQACELSKIKTEESLEMAIELFMESGYGDYITLVNKCADEINQLPDEDSEAKEKASIVPPQVETKEENKKPVEPQVPTKTVEPKISTKPVEQNPSVVSSKPQSGNRRKKIIAALSSVFGVIIIVLIVLGSITAAHNKEYGKCSFKYDRAIGGYVLTEFKQGKTTKIEIPSTYMGKEVKSIGKYAFLFTKKGTIEEISLPDTLIRIEEYAFENATVKWLVIPNSVTYIGSGAFASCKNLKTIRLPNAITEIPSSCFARCASLTKVEIPDSVKSIGTRAFANCESLTKISLGKGVETLGDSFLKETPYVTSLTLPSGFKYFDEQALAYSAVYAIYGEAALEEIPAGCFWHSSADSIRIPNGVKTLGINCFYEYTGVVYLPDTIEKFERNCFGDGDCSVMYAGTQEQWIELLNRCQADKTLLNLPRSVTYNVK